MSSSRSLRTHPQIPKAVRDPTTSVNSSVCTRRGTDGSGVTTTGLAARVNITGAEAANDRLTVNALAGDDVVEA
jgi:hypothetical protein